MEVTTFTALGADQTIVRLSLEYEPEGLVERAGDKLNIIDRQAQSDLDKFKSFIEDRGRETGGWRGSVDEGAAVGTPGVEAASSSQGDSGKAGLSTKTVAAGVVAGVAGVAAAKALSGDSEDTTESSEPVRPVDTTVAAPPVVQEEVVVEETVVQEPVSYDPGVDNTPGRTP